MPQVPFEPIVPKPAYSRSTVIAVVGVFGVLLILGMIGAAADKGRGRATSSSPPPEEPTKKASSVLGAAKVSCSPSGFDSLTCRVESTGIGDAKPCWDSVVICGGTTHRAHTCAGLMKRGAVESHVVRGFNPVITANETCETIRVENLTFD